MQVEWRRAKVLELLSKGDSQSEIAKVLQVDLSIISRDVYFLRQQAKSNIKRYIDERLPEEYEKCLVGLNAITREAWNTAQSTEDKREKIQALSLAKECYSMKLVLQDRWSRFYWLWIAYEPNLRSCLMLHLSRERTIFVCYQFFRQLRNIDMVLVEKPFTQVLDGITMLVNGSG